MRGLDPRIHHLRKSLSRKMDYRVKPGNDGVFGGPLRKGSTRKGYVLHRARETVRTERSAVATLFSSRRNLFVVPALLKVLPRSVCNGWIERPMHLAYGPRAAGMAKGQE